MARAKNPSAQRVTLEALGIDQVCDMLREGKSYRDIAKVVGVSYPAVWKWVNGDEDRAALARAALQDSADAWDLEAERVLQGIGANASKAEVARARELAQHYRWRAAKRNPRVYSEKQQLDVNGSLEVPLSEEQIDVRLERLLAKKPSAD